MKLQHLRAFALFALLLPACEPYNPLNIDDDGDGFSEFDGDCDDHDADSTVIAEDADCDGVPTAADCDDNDANLGAESTDADCDGSNIFSDCDDNDAGSTVVAEDADCDGPRHYVYIEVEETPLEEIQVIGPLI